MLRALAIAALVFALGCEDDVLLPAGSPPSVAAPDVGQRAHLGLDAGFQPVRNLRQVALPVSGAVGGGVRVRVGVPAMTRSSSPDHTTKLWVGAASMQEER